MDRIKALALGFQTLLQPKDFPNGAAPRVGIWAENCPEWMETFIALQAIGYTSVPIYKSFGPNAAADLISRARLELLVACKSSVEKLVEAKEMGRAQSVRCVVQIDNNEIFGIEDQVISEAVRSRAAASGIKVKAFSQVLREVFLE